MSLTPTSCSELKEKLTRFFLQPKWILIPLYGLGYWVANRTGIHCIWNHFFHIVCPCCGFTRAVLHAVRLDFASAFFYHPMFWSFPLIVLLFLTDGKLFKKERWNRFTFAVLILGFAAVWVVRLIHKPEFLQ